jgi:hypothetical protein
MFKRSNDFLLTVHVPAGVDPIFARYNYYRKIIEEELPDGARIFKFEGPYKPILWLAQTAKHHDKLEEVYLEYQGEFAAHKKPGKYLVQ